MQPLDFIRGIQITDSFFPVGAFAYSDGLETAAAEGRVHDAASLGRWMEHFLDAVFVPCDGLGLVKCMRALKAGDFEVLSALDCELTAVRPAREVRAASIAVGKRLLSLYSLICDNPCFSDHARILPYGNAAAAYATVFFYCDYQEREAVMAFGYNRLAGIVSTGLRLITIGHQQGQVLLSKAVRHLPDAAERILQMASAEEPLRSFSPALDIRQMNHQYLYSRLFRS